MTGVVFAVLELGVHITGRRYTRKGPMAFAVFSALLVDGLIVWTALGFAFP